ncbi:MAG: hypothetical protein KA007_00460 [Candidatus Pacebacteria bacterium]|jgi:hypothetical protein|nr:hypothetical protein [Candidatus Paceibacterota bacterium]
MDKQLLKKLVNAECKRSQKDDFADGMGGTVKVFVVETETSRCKIWNSSNNSSFNLTEACKEISNALLDHSVEDCLMEGHFSIGFNEIWFEMEEK